MEKLSLAGNRLTTLDLSKVSNLKVLHCYDNLLTSLDVSPLKQLNYLICLEQKEDELGKKKRVLSQEVIGQLIQNLPNRSGQTEKGTIAMEHNHLSPQQKEALKAKGWTTKEGS